MFAQGGPGHGGAGAGTIYFDPDTVDTLSGTVTEAYNDWEIWGHGNHTGGGMGFEFQDDQSGESFALMLAPLWYLEENGIEMSVGDRITVEGSLVDAYINSRGHHRMSGHTDIDYIIVTVINVGSTRLELRDDRGYPLWSSGHFGGMYFDLDTITTIKGEFVENLGLWSCYGYGNTTGNGMHMLFESSEGARYYAMLGPWWYLEELGVVIQESSKAKITGSVVDSYWDGYDEYDYIIATEITVDGVTVKLRDDNGYPLWSGTGWHYYSPGYDKSSTDVIIGTVKRTRVRTNGVNYDPGFEIIVRNNTGRYRLFVSPEWYSDQLKLNIKKGQTIRVKGSVELVRGKRFDVVVRNFRIAGSRHVFRTAPGTPVWVKGAG